MRLKTLALAMLCFVLFGCNGGEGDVMVGVDNSPPSVIATFSKTELPFSGGTVTITVKLNDPSGIESAKLNINPSPVGFQPISLVTPNQKEQPTTFSTTVTVVLPLNPSGANAVYRVMVEAKDALGNEGTIIVGTLTVQSLPSGLASPPRPSDTFQD